MDTKYFPNVRGMMGRPVTHLGPEDMRGGLADSLKALDTDSVDLWYLHAPDRSVPIEDTLAAVHELYQQGKFKKWGVSNYMAWEGSSIFFFVYFQFPSSKKLKKYANSRGDLRTLPYALVPPPKRLPGRVQRLPPHYRIRTPPLSASLRHGLLRLQPSCWGLANRPLSPRLYNH
jgi:hypothetical protein